MTQFHRAAVNGRGRKLMMQPTTTRKCFSHIASYSDRINPLTGTSILSHEDQITAVTNFQIQCLKFCADDAGMQMEHCKFSTKLKPRILRAIIASVETFLSWVSGFWTSRNT